MTPAPQRTHQTVAVQTAPLAISLMKEEVKRRVHNIEHWED